METGTLLEDEHERTQGARMPNAGRDEGANTGRGEGANTERDEGANAGTATKADGNKRRVFIHHMVAAD